MKEKKRLEMRYLLSALDTAELLTPFRDALVDHFLIRFNANGM